MIRALTFFLAVLGSHQAQASEGIKFAFVYICKAATITEKTVNTCTLKFPELAARGASTLDAWRRRNAIDAQRGVELCDAELHKQFSSGVQIEEMKARIAQLEREYIDVLDQEIANRGVAACNELLTTIGHPESDLSWLLPK